MIILTRTEYRKQANKWELVEQDKQEVNYDIYLNIIDRRFFKALGGIERSTRNYTPRGYRVTKQTSISPDRTIKVTYEFDFS